MSDNEEYGVGARGKRFDPGEGPQLLAQLQATGGTQVFGSDGERVGALKEVGDANFVVDRGALRGEVCVLVDRIREVTSDGRIVLDVPADRVDETGRAKRIASRGG
jgi:hypothetical protein